MADATRGQAQRRRGYEQQQRPGQPRQSGGQRELGCGGAEAAVRAGRAMPNVNAGRSAELRGAAETAARRRPPAAPAHSPHKNE